MTTTDTSDRVEDAVREAIREGFYREFTDCPEVRVNKVEWDTNGQARCAGPYLPTEIAGCRAKADVIVLWPRTLWSRAAMQEAMSAFDDADLLAGWCRKEICAHTSPPRGKYDVGEQVQELTWKIKRVGIPAYEVTNQRLIVPCEVRGER